MKKEAEEALEELARGNQRPSQCWGSNLPDEAQEFLYSIEELEIAGRKVHRPSAAGKFNELFGDELERNITATMISNHMIKNCTCQLHREYGWPPEKKK